MILKTSKSYQIQVNDYDNNKCSKDCKYMGLDSHYGCICSLSQETSSVVGNELIENDNRTNYCKKFFEGVRG